MWVIHSWPWYWLVWPWWRGQMYRIVTGVTSDVGVPLTYLVVSCNGLARQETPYPSQCWTRSISPGVKALCIPVMAHIFWLSVESLLVGLYVTIYCIYFPLSNRITQDRVCLCANKCREILQLLHISHWSLLLAVNLPMGTKEYARQNRSTPVQKEVARSSSPHLLCKDFIHT